MNSQNEFQSGPQSPSAASGSPDERLKSERRRIAEAYQRRSSRDSGDIYSYFNPGNLFIVQQRERLVLRLLSREGFRDLSETTILEVGCGTGNWLRSFVQWGAKPERVHGIELLEPRVKQCRALCPADMDIRHGDAAALPWPDEHFDLVLQATVFSSILDAGVKQRLAAEMLRVVKPQGMILWYDLRTDNPRNPDVRGIGRREIRRLFPHCRIELRRLTLLPPLTRLLAPYSWLSCHLLSWIPLLCTHYLGAIRKQAAR